MNTECWIWQGSQEKEFEEAAELSDAGNSFLQTYDSKFCHGMNYHVTESKRNQ